MNILKSTIAIGLSLCIMAGFTGCKKDDVNTKDAKDDVSQTEIDDTQIQQEEKLENTDVTPSEFEELVKQANSDNEEEKQEALQKLQVILEQLEANAEIEQ